MLNPPLNVGKTLRLSRIFRDGKTLIVAMDHGLESGPVKGLERVRETVSSVLVDGVNAVMTSFGVSRAVADIIAGKTALITTIPEDEQYVAAAVKMGADAVKTTYFGSVPLSQEKIRIFSRVARECEDYGIPYLVEVVPTSSTGEVIFDAAKVAAAARIGAEIGGDFVKIPYTGSYESFRLVIEACPVPAVIMGGPKVERETEVLRWVLDSLKAGGAGVAFGRNIWQHKNPSSMVRAIAKVLHHGAKIEEAVLEIAGSR